ncbi:MAG: SDR family oxidoreductase [Bacteroidales bacterium]|jgi:NAD(P)-dependent dehydrogenase (short-subunit alcohol dehydrogenase family)|nr:SDR family oxidoreductase [Bacteroidales bacterium]
MDINPFSLREKTFLITGAASGIGRATSLFLSQMGAKLLLVDINENGLKETLQACASTDDYLIVDLSIPSEIKDKVLTKVCDFGKLNGLVHLAGKPYIAPLKSINERKCQEIYNLNTYSAIELAKTFINRNVYAGGTASIVLVSSVYGIVGSAANVGYAMSKSAIIGITKSLSMELASKGIRVNCVAPGFIKTKMSDDINPMFDESHSDILEKLHPLGLGDPEDIAYAISYLLSDASKWVTGAVFNIDGGFTAQ